LILRNNCETLARFEKNLIGEDSMAPPDSPVSRRNLIKLGTFTGLATALSPVLRLSEAHADRPTKPTPSPTPTPIVCNADRPSTPAAALEALIQGNEAWATLNQTHPGEDATRRACVAENGQTPFAAIISCSDSRVPPELVFDQGLGDLFVARVAGNGATGTLSEGLYFGTSILGSLVLFVLGHTDCGAVKTAVTSFPNHDLEFVKLIFPAVVAARRIVEQAGGDPNDANLVVPVATEQNVILEVKALRRSRFFRKMVQDGTLLIAGGVYDLATQRVNILIQ
jgi:carbonic anhydrase